MVKELSHSRRILSTCDKTQIKWDKVSMTPFSSKTQNFPLKICFMLLPGIADRSEFTSDKSL